jgi:hypothetical protein
MEGLRKTTRCNLRFSPPATIGCIFLDLRYQFGLALFVIVSFVSSKRTMPPTVHGTWIIHLNHPLPLFRVDRLSISPRQSVPGRIGFG